MPGAQIAALDVTSVAQDASYQGAELSCAPGEAELYCATRRLLGSITNLSALRLSTPLFRAWLNTTAPNPWRAPTNRQCGALSLSVGAENLNAAVACMLKRAIQGGGCRAAQTPLIVYVDAENIEFGYTLFQTIPDAFMLCAHGVLRVRSFCEGMRPFFFFAGAAQLASAHVRRCDLTGINQSDFTRQHNRPLFNFRARQPPFRSAFRMPLEANYSASCAARPGRTGCATPRLAFVFNKRGILGMPHWHPSGEINSWGLPDLINLVRKLLPLGNVVYFRPGSIGVDDDDQAAFNRQMHIRTSHSYNELLELRRKMPEATLLLDVLVRGGFPQRPRAALLDHANAAQLLLTASADVVVGTQGESGVLTSLTSRRFVMLCRSGQECVKDARWWSQYNTATMVTGGNISHLTILATSLLANLSSGKIPIGSSTIYHNGGRRLSPPPLEQEPP